ncbi:MULTISPECIES: hypothetical protein [Staphylococcus]|uniref:Lipoprotein n=1 Tax=Staphylococcus hsinchuensis TaxID=3051183 RepID=A0ABZ3EG32_9STAP|nr:hypothetical protein [Staphylococcus sp. Marseille-Q5304]
MNWKNMMLGVSALFLACCLCFLLIIATNENALMKVHHTISNVPNMSKIANAKEKDNNGHEASLNLIDKVKNGKEQKKPYHAKHYIPIAERETHNLKLNEIGKAELPQFSEALGKARSTVNHDNHANNKYNDYGIDSTCQGKYYYIFTFKNRLKPHTYYKVLVDNHNEARIIDKSFNIKGGKPSHKPSISPQESEVIAQKHATDKLGNSTTLSNVEESKDGMCYKYQSKNGSKTYQIIIDKNGNVNHQHTIN